MTLVDLIRQGEYEKAFAQSHTLRPVAKKELHIVSLLCRYYDKYDEEKKIIEQGLIAFPDWIYLHDRNNWHKRPYFHPDITRSKLVPRPIAQPTKLEKYLPRAEILAQIAFVISGGAGIFNYVVECLESLKNTSYRQIPICLLTSALFDPYTSEQINYLQQHFPIHHIQQVQNKRFPEFVLDRARNEMVVNMPYIHDYFPSYRYLFFIEPDIWIYDEICLDKLIWLGEQQGCAITHHSTGMFVSDRERNLLNEWQQRIDYTLWRNAASDVDPAWQSQELPFSMLYKEKNLIAVNKYQTKWLRPSTQHLYHAGFDDIHWHNYYFEHHGLPIIRGNKLADPLTLRPITSFHYSGYMKSLNDLSLTIRSYDHSGYVNTCVLEESHDHLMQEQILQHILYYRKHSKISERILFHHDYSEDIANIYTHPISMRFRVWPWADKVELKQALQDQCV